MSMDHWLDHLLGSAAEGADALQEAFGQIDPELLAHGLESLDLQSIAEALHASGVDVSQLSGEDLQAVLGAALATSSGPEISGLEGAPDALHHELRFGSSQGGLNHEPQSAEEISLRPDEAPRAAELLERSGFHPTKTVATGDGITTVPAGQYYHSKTSR